MKKKVLILTNKMVVGGVEKALINILQNIDIKKYQITVALPNKGGEFEKLIPHYIEKKYLYNFDVSKLNKFKSLILEYFLLLAPGWLCNQIFIRDKYDICIAYSANMIYQIKGFEGEKICWIHDNYFPFGTRNNIRGNFRKKRTINYMKSCKRVICVSSRLKSLLKSYSEDRLNNIVVLRNPVNIKDIEDKSYENINEINVPDCIKLISVGRLDKIKGYDRLISICNKLKIKGYKFNLWIIGGGTEYETLNNLIKQYDLCKEVQLLGEQINPYKYLKKSDIFVCSSYKEGYSTAISEAVILKNAIISTDCGGSDEILDYGKYGIITKNNEDDLLVGIERLLKDKGLINYYKEMSNERKKIFNISENIKNIEEILDRR